MTSRRRAPRLPKTSELADVPRLARGAADERLQQILHAASMVLLKHPVAAQAAFSAFVAEGRRFAETPEGQRWRTALADSDLVRAGAALWAGSVLNTLEDRSDTMLPSTIADAIVRAARQPDLTAFLQSLHREIDGADSSVV